MSPATAAKSDAEQSELFGAAPEVKAGTTREVVYLELTSIEPDPEQPRKDADAELEASIRQEGVIQPITVRDNPDPAKAKAGIRYRIKYGERRFVGSIKAGRTTIPAIIDNDTKEDEARRLVRQVVENHHKSLEPMEEAAVFSRIQQLTGASVNSLAKMLGKPKSTIGDRLALAEAPAPFKPLFASGIFTAAAAPIVRRFAGVPVEILEKAVADAREHYTFREAAQKGKPVSLANAERVLADQILETHTREIPESLALLYQGPSLTIGSRKYATDLPAFEKAHKAYYLEKERARAADEAKRSPSRSSGNSAETRARKEARRKAQLRRLQFAALSEKLPTEIAGAGWAAFLLDAVLAEVHADTCRVVCGLLDLEAQPAKQYQGMSKYADAIRKHAKSLTPAGVIKLSLQILLAPDATVHPHYLGGAKRFAAAAALTKVDLGRIKIPDELEPAKAPKKAKARRRLKPDPFKAPMQPSAALAAIVGSKPLVRTEVTKKLWSYIKRHGLQDRKERRLINADAKLKLVFNGRRRVSMFDMTKLIAKHLTAAK